jgi:hypothetical protein
MKCIALLLVAVFTTGCAQVKVLKANTVQDQEGIPFYLPRPYVQVFEPFVINSQAELAAGVVSPDEKFLLIDASANLARLGIIPQSAIGKDGAVPLGSVRRMAEASSGTGRPEGNSSTVNAKAGPGARDGNAPPAPNPPTDASAPPPGADAKPVGNFNVSVTNTSAIFPPTLGRRYFDVIWLPDFDEKYTVQATPGLGNTSIGITMTQGWGLYGLDARVDNSALVKPLLDFYASSLDALSKLARSNIAPSGPQGRAGSTLPGENERELVANTRVTVKVTKVHVVAPGLYPILKPTELTAAEHAGRNGAAPGLLLPRNPYMNIGFHTYEVIVIEAAKPAGDTPMNLQHYFDAETPPAPAQRHGGPALSTNEEPFEPATFEATINEALKQRADKTKHYQIHGSALDGRTLNTTVSSVGSGPEPPESKDDLKTYLRNLAKGRFDNVVFK